MTGGSFTTGLLERGVTHDDDATIIGDFLAEMQRARLGLVAAPPPA